MTEKQALEKIYDMKRDDLLEEAKTPDGVDTIARVTSMVPYRAIRKLIIKIYEDCHKGKK